jgi:hypothetical protein
MSPRDEPVTIQRRAAVLAPVDPLDAQASPWLQRWRAFEQSLVRYNLEARGIQRVLPDQRHDRRQLGFMQIFVLWTSINLAANNLTLGVRP